MITFLAQLGHLAEVEEDQEARVLSWHLAGDIDCVVTRTNRRVMAFHLNSTYRIQQKISLFLNSGLLGEFWGILSITIGIYFITYKPPDCM